MLAAILDHKSAIALFFARGYEQLDTGTPILRHMVPDGQLCLSVSSCILLWLHFEFLCIFY